MHIDLPLISAWLQGLVCHSKEKMKVLLEEEEEVSLHQEQEAKGEIKLLLTYSCSKENSLENAAGNCASRFVTTSCL